MLQQTGDQVLGNAINFAAEHSKNADDFRVRTGHHLIAEPLNNVWVV
jgi:hypothetical protein